MEEKKVFKYNLGDNVSVLGAIGARKITARCWMENLSGSIEETYVVANIDGSRFVDVSLIVELYENHFKK
jgi:hypothetical protein